MHGWRWMSAMPSRTAAVLGAAAILLAAAGPTMPVERRIPAEEARQGAASDGRFVYAIDNSRIGKYRIADGQRVVQWVGDPAVVPHINSCAAVRRELVCASSNYPAVPQTSSVEFFDLRTLRHLRSHRFGPTDGSLTAFDRHGGVWWAVFAQYDGKGGAVGKDHRATRLTRLDDRFRATGQWTLPPALLERLAPHSVSGASWTARGDLALTGHDRPEVYLVTVPRRDGVVTLDKIVPVTTEGQAIAWDPRRRTALWSISRRDRALVLTDLSEALSSVR